MRTFRERGGSIGVAMCPICKRRLAVRLNGRFYPHHNPRQPVETPMCRGGRAKNITYSSAQREEP